VTASRVVSAVVFASTAITPRYVGIAIAAYAYASLADLLDGFVARALKRESKGGAAFDIGGDKYLLIVSALYAAAIGANIAACCLLIVRAVFIPALRTVHIDGVPLIPPDRRIAAAETLPIRMATAYMLLSGATGVPVNWTLANTLYWSAAIMSCASVAYSVVADWPRIVRAFRPTTSAPTSR
jgi:phosphatidylglycerophosphate synthase